MWVNLLVGLLIPVAIVVGLFALVARRGLQMKLLAAEGVPATARVVAKLTTAHPGRHRSATRRIRYAYEDAQGQSHEHVSLVTESFFDQHVEGGPIAIVYARSKPAISAPAALVESARAALAKRGA